MSSIARVLASTVTPARRTIVLCSLVCSAGCVDPLQAPSAFSGERYLCDAAQADLFEAAVEDCRQAQVRDRSCEGFISYRGVIDSAPVVVDTRLSRVSFFDAVQPSGILSRRFSMNGRSPYFAFRLDSGGYALAPGQSTSGPRPESTCDISQPGTVCVTDEQFNAEARGGNYLSGLVREIRDVRIDTATDLRVSFTAGLARGGTLDACFHLFGPGAP